jgi:hypothetical protein
VIHSFQLLLQQVVVEVVKPMQQAQVVRVVVVAITLSQLVRQATRLRLHQAKVIVAVMDTQA